MNRIQKLFLRKQKEILNIYFTAGYPSRDDTIEIIHALDQAGVDLIEIGMPYSDPLADGPTIQQSSAIALANGMNMSLLFEQIKTARQQTQVPLILMGYYNQVLQYGADRFFEDAKAAGVDGFILPDLPLYEYEEQYKEKLEALELSITFLITPQTTDERIAKIDELSSGFVYIVSSAAITGAKKGISPAQLAYFERIHSLSLKNPKLIGFGISDATTFNTACQYAAGAIIGSAFIKQLAKSEASIASKVSSFVSSIKS